MRQIGSEKEDPLKRIQEEINEVARRERELRNKIAQQEQQNGNIGLTSTTTTTTIVDDQTTTQLDAMSGMSDDSGISSSSSPINGVSSNVKDNNNLLINDSIDNNNVTDISIATIANNIIADNTGSTNTNNDNITTTSTSKIINNINTIKDKLSNGGSGGTAVVNNDTMDTPILNNKRVNYQRSRTINPSPPSTVNSSSSTPQTQYLKLTRAMSTPQIFQNGTTKRFNMVNSGQKGFMQRFIASRGKVATANRNGVGGGRDPVLTSIELNRTPLFISPDFSPPVIERDEDGRPLRRGYVPVEEKIQKELRDIKNRECELKKLRRMNKLRQSQPDLLDDINDSVEFDSGEESDEGEHCYPPGKLRASKSIGELCDALNNNASLSPRETPSPQFNRSTGTTVAGRPVMSLAELCDVDPQEAPSSHRLIAQWENLIQQRQEVA